MVCVAKLCHGTVAPNKDPVRKSIAAQRIRTIFVNVQMKV